MKSIADYDLSKRSEKGFEFEVVDENGNPDGTRITVLGDNAPSVEAFIYKKINERRAQEDLRERQGKKAKLRTVEDEIQYSTALVASRVIAWNLEDECTHENVALLCTFNPLLKEQILKASGDIGNFPKG